MKSAIKCGYLPLVDSAPLIIAKDLLFAAQEGLDLTLVKQPSWSAVRDHLAFGEIDFAHLLSPMPIAMTSGLSGLPVEIDALMVLSTNGTVIGVSSDLAGRMLSHGWKNTFDNPEATSVAALAVTQKVLRIGVPFPFSMHRLLIDRWLRQNPNFTPDRVEIITVPPPQMSQAVCDGRIDMFCVGEPWGSVAVQDSGAVLVLPTVKIFGFAPEKVLGARADWVLKNKPICFAMIRAVYRAAQWLEQPKNLPLAVEILTSSEHLDLPDHAIEPALTGRIIPCVGADPVEVERFLMFHEGGANFPWHCQASSIAQQLGTTEGTDCFRGDIYSEALVPLGVRMPEAPDSTLLEADTFPNGAVFDSHHENTPEN